MAVKVRIVNKLILAASFVLFAAALVFLARSVSSGSFGGLKLQNLKGIFSFGIKSQKSGFWSVMEEIRNLDEFVTAEYRMKLVFPFDFVEGEKPDWVFLKQQYDLDSDIFLAKADPSWYENGQLPPQWQNAKLYYYCRQAGMDPGRPDYRFLVISLSVTAGVDVDRWLHEIEMDRNKDKQNASFSQVADKADKAEKREGGEVKEDPVLRIPEPPVTIFSFIIEDRNSVDEGFPDVPVSPEKWQVLVKELEPLLINTAEKEGLLESAESGSREFIRGIFMAAGYKDVVFVKNEK